MNPEDLNEFDKIDYGISKDDSIEVQRQKIEKFEEEQARKWSVAEAKAAARDAIDDLVTFSFEGELYGFNVAQGSIVNMDDKSDMQIYSSGGYGGVPVSVKSHTSRQQVISVLRSDDGIRLDLKPESRLHANVGMNVWIISFGPGSRVGDGVVMNTSYNMALIPMGTTNVLMVHTPRKVLAYFKSLKSHKPWVIGMIASLFMIPFTMLGALIGLGGFFWGWKKVNDANNSLQNEVQERITKIAGLLANR